MTQTHFLHGALAACGAVTITNPMEVCILSLTIVKVCKTRLQLQGELNASLRNPHYSNPLTTLTYIFKNEGIRGIQKGLFPGYIYQFLLNGTRLGLYEPLRNVIKANLPDGPACRTGAMVTSGLFSGVLGAFIASPMFLVKTRMQSYSPTVSGQVGHQHAYVSKGTVHTLKYIYGKEGIRGLWRGSDARFKI
jgi:solute carrier family 25 protein 34/35